MPGIVDVSNRGWPRAVESAEGVVRLEAPPQRVLALSLGHDEMLLALLPRARFAESTYAAGAGSTEGGIVEAAGGINAAARDGIAGHQTVSRESIAAMNPDVILITQPEDSGGTELRDDLLADRALAEVPAVVEQRVLIAAPRYYTTLSHWNVRGIEETARLLYPDRFRDVTFADFAPYAGS